MPIPDEDDGTTRYARAQEAAQQAARAAEKQDDQEGGNKGGKGNKGSKGVAGDNDKACEPPMSCKPGNGKASIKEDPSVKEEVSASLDLASYSFANLRFVRCLLC